MIGFIKKMWRGQYPLWRAFWINTVLVNLVLAIVFAFFLSVSLEDKKFAIRLIMNYNLISVFICVWQVVGVWRSSELKGILQGALSWAFFARMFTILYFVRLMISFIALFLMPATTIPVLDQQIDDLLRIKQEQALVLTQAQSAAEMSAQSSVAADKK